MTRGAGCGQSARPDLWGLGPACDTASRIEGPRRKPGAHPTGSLHRGQPGLPDAQDPEYEDSHLESGVFQGVGDPGREGHQLWVLGLPGEQALL